jgi:hypothetical protein
MPTRGKDVLLELFEKLGQAREGGRTNGAARFAQARGVIQRCKSMRALVLKSALEICERRLQPHILESGACGLREFGCGAAQRSAPIDGSAMPENSSAA